MAVKFHTTLIYGINKVELWNYNDLGELIDFNFTTTLNLIIERADGAGSNYTANAVVDSGGDAIATKCHATFNLDIPFGAALYLDGDTILDYDNPTYEHIYSVRADYTGETFVYGNVNMIKVA